MAVTTSFHRVSAAVTSMLTWSPGLRAETWSSSHWLFCLLTVRTSLPWGIWMDFSDSRTWSTVHTRRPPTVSWSVRTREPVTSSTSRVPSAGAAVSRLWESAATLLPSPEPSWASAL